MKIYILFILLLFNISTLIANETIKVGLESICTKLNVEEFTMTIRSHKLELTKDAVQYNIDGYVDIPEDDYYLQDAEKVYKLDGVVENLNLNKTNIFTADIYNNSTNFLTIKELFFLTNSKNLKFIQSINLQRTSRITTNTLDVYFDKELFNIAHKKCEEQINEPKKNLYLPSLSVILFILLILYLLRRNQNLK